MLILDRLMMKDTYDNSPAQAIIISSVGGTIFGLLSTFIWWTIGPDSLSVYAGNAISWLYPYGLLVMVAGVLSSQVLHQYFVCFSKKIDSNVIASWIAATPVFVYIAMIGLEQTNIILGESLYSISTLGGVLLTTLGLYCLEKSSTCKTNGQDTYHINLLMFLVLSVIYIILIDWTLETGSSILAVSTTTFTMSLLPWFWVGFLYGARTALKKKHRDKFKTNWPKVRMFLLPIFVLEIIGMYVFFFEFIGLGELDPLTVALITGLHAVVVWLVSVGLGLYSKKMVRNKREFISFAGLQLSQDALEQFDAPMSVRRKQAQSAFIVMIGLILFF